MFQETRSLSTNTGVAPRYTIGLTLATIVRVLTRTSSPGPTPTSRSARCSAAVPEQTATAWGAPIARANSRSKASTCGPRGATQLLAKTSATSRPSRPLMWGGDK